MKRYKPDLQTTTDGDGRKSLVVGMSLMASGGDWVAYADVEPLERQVAELRDENDQVAQFNLLLRMLAEWLKSQQGAVSKAYLTDRDGALAFVVVRNSRDYDDDFEDVISELDFRIANDPDLGLIRMDVIALPYATEAAITSFVNPGFAFEYAGDGSRS
jgi:hypothetical protein